MYCIIYYLHVNNSCFGNKICKTLGDSNKISPTPVPPTPVTATLPPSLRPPLRPLRSPPPPAPRPSTPCPFASASPSPVCPPQPRFIQRRRRPHAPYLLGAAPTGHGPHHHLRLLHSGVWARASDPGPCRRLLPRGGSEQADPADAPFRRQRRRSFPTPRRIHPVSNRGIFW